MNEIEQLNARIEALEAQAKGQEMAVYSLALALSAAGDIDLKRISTSLEVIVKSFKETYDLGDSVRPLDNLVGLLATSAKSADDHSSR